VNGNLIVKDQVALTIGIGMDETLKDMRLAVERLIKLKTRVYRTFLSGLNKKIDTFMGFKAKT
jgi:hypothetical protein